MIASKRSLRGQQIHFLALRTWHLVCLRRTYNYFAAVLTFFQLGLTAFGDNHYMVERPCVLVLGTHICCKHSPVL